MPETTQTLSLCDSKYELVRAGGSLHCLRHGEPWRDLTGDKMVGAMFDELLELRKTCDDLHSAIVELEQSGPKP